MNEPMHNDNVRCALVVGAGRGLGRTVALTLARAGYAVVVAARTQAEIELVADEVRALQAGAPGAGAIVVAADATQPDQVARLVASALEHYGRIDVLVNCAGEALIKPTLENSDGDWQRIINSNLTSTFLTCRAVMPHMMAQRSGHIVNIASRVARDGAPGVAAYSAAKAGVVGFSKALGQELKPFGVKVSVICPGPMDTPMRWDATPDWDRAKVIAPQRIADLIALLIASPDTTLDELYPVSIHA
jgi:NAD(P)-dependent dehydrogenase (short-subunit alcohol dehydrogenase family)